LPIPSSSKFQFSISRTSSADRRALMIALDVDQLAVEANRLLPGLTLLSRVVHEVQDDAGS
jgi:hypothetical protein